MFLRWAVLASSLFILAACETHSSAARKAEVGSGAVVTPERKQVSVYNAPTKAYRKQKAAEKRTAARKKNARTQTTRMRPTPVSAVYLSEVEEQAPAPARRGEAIVRPGDTVYAIGRRYDVHPNAIIDINRLQHPYSLAIGQRLRLPQAAQQQAAERAPVRKVVARDMTYEVRRGDTLYSISRNAGVDLSTVARANKIRAPYSLSVGQQLLIPQAKADSTLYAENLNQEQTIAVRARPTPEPRNVAELAQNVSYTRPALKTADSLFEWPVRGKVVGNYGNVELGRRNDGVNIAAPAGTPVRAAADGEVVYRGSELDGFGNLLLVKHQSGYVTAYAHNDSMLVKKGDQVRQGQVIAKVGSSGSVSSPQLHFEVRRNLKAIDPISLLGPS